MDTVAHALTGPQLVTALHAAGVSLHLDASGRLHCTPPAVAQPYRAAMRQHLPFLLVCAAVAEVQRLLHTHQVTWTQCRPMVAVQALNEACQSGEVDRTRAEAVRYVEAWHEWLTKGAPRWTP